MKKLFKFSIASVALSFLVGGGLLVSNKQNIPTKTDASDTITNLPHMVSDFNSSTGRYWTSNSDLTAVNNHISSSTTGYRVDSPITVSTYSVDYTDSYIKASYAPSKGYKTMHAIYVPFHMDFNIPATSEYKLYLTFTVSANRAASGGGADYSAELFSYGDSSSDLSSGSYFYVPDDFRTSTGDSYSVIRSANGTAHSGISVNPATNDKLVTYTFSNATNAIVTKTLRFGLFAYVESSGTTTNSFEAQVRLKSALFDANFASYVCNGKNFMSDNFAGAWSEFNGGNNRTLELFASANALSDLVYNKSGGTLKLNTSTITMGTNIMYCNGSFTITATNSYGTITGARDHSTLFLNAAATVTLAGYATIENTALSGNRAILIANEGATLIVGSGNTIVSATHCVWVDAGTLRINGGYLRNTRTGAYYPVYTGTSASTKNVYVYGAATFSNATFSIASLDSNVNIYAKYSDTYYTGSANIEIYLRTTNTLAINQVGVRDVSSSNYSKFSLWPANLGYVFTKSGNNLIVGYRTNTVTYNLTNLTSNGAATCTIGSNLSFTLSPNSGYALPNHITVTVGSTTLTENSDYTYNSTTGAVVILKENLKLNVTVTASALVEYTVTFMDENGQAADPIVVKGSQTINLPESDNEPAYYSTSWYENPEFTGSSYVPGSIASISSNKTFYAKYTQTARQMVEEFVGVELHFDRNVIPTSDLRDTGECKGETGYYAVAKSKYNSLANVSKKIFCEDEEFANGRARFIAWANANGEDLNLSTYAIVQLSNQISLGDSNNNSSSVNIVIIAVTVSTLMLTGLLVLKKKRATK